MTGERLSVEDLARLRQRAIPENVGTCRKCGGELRRVADGTGDGPPFNPEGRFECDQRHPAYRDLGDADLAALLAAYDVVSRDAARYEEALWTLRHAANDGPEGGNDTVPAALVERVAAAALAAPSGGDGDAGDR